MTHGIMIAVIRPVFLLATLALGLGACSTEPEKQWYKSGGNYTVAEFRRDRDACTRNNVLDEECMKERGWIAISADIDKGPPPMKGGSQLEDTRHNAPK
jgi:hypothetical protein